MVHTVHFPPKLEVAETKKLTSRRPGPAAGSALLVCGWQLQGLSGKSNLEECPRRKMEKGKCALRSTSKSEV